MDEDDGESIDGALVEMSGGTMTLVLCTRRMDVDVGRADGDTGG